MQYCLLIANFDEGFNDQFITNLLQSLPVKECRRMVNSVYKVMDKSSLRISIFCITPYHTLQMYMHTCTGSVVTQKRPINGCLYVYS